MARSALTVAALVVAAIALATAQAKCINYTEEDLASDDSMWALYERWAAHNKVTRDSAEKTRRFPIFKKNARLIHELNLQRNVRNKLGLNDMTDEEFMDGWTGFRYSPSDIPEHFGDMPSRSREKRAVTYVKKQEDRGAPPYPIMTM